LTGEGGLSYDNSKQTLVVIISSYKSFTTKKKEMMGFFTVEDLTGSMDMVVFPNLFRKKQDILTPNSVLIVEGTIQFKEDIPSLLADDVYDADSEEALRILKSKKDEKYGLYLKVSCMNDAKFKRSCNVLSNYRGMTPVFFYLSDEKKYILAPKKLWVRNSENAMRELRYILGEENVAYRG
jgi:DNA polymerase-3 subunit alpha